MTTTEEKVGFVKPTGEEHERTSRTGRRWLPEWELAAVVNRRKTTGEMSEQ